MLTTIFRKQFNTLFPYLAIIAPDLFHKASLFFPLQEGNGIFPPVSDCSRSPEAHIDEIQYGVRLEHSFKYFLVFVFFFLS